MLDYEKKKEDILRNLQWQWVGVHMFSYIVWSPVLFRISTFVFWRRKKVVQMNDMRIKKRINNLFFWVNYPCNDLDGTVGVPLGVSIFPKHRPHALQIHRELFFTLVLSNCSYLQCLAVIVWTNSFASATFSGVALLSVGLHDSMTSSNVTRPK